MSRRVILALLALLAALFVPPAASADPASDLCRPAIAAAEQAHGIPARLLAAIARVESGRLDPATGKRNPWPWTINADGQGSFYDVKAQAVAAAASMRPHVTRSIDVGCMQISLTNHPNAFASLEQAFDPAANADYGARFLRRLYEKTQSWPKAVGMYHSATPDLASDYQSRVYAAWPEELQTTPARPLFAGISPFGFGWNRNPVGPMAMPTGPRIIPLGSPAGSGGLAGPMQGRSLASYRAMPVRLVAR
ncbi:MAG TPA: lytic transglycosylase domain-containing protein, partial [Rhodopila sp.]|uniref:lytic transglycosylase domain-containing protein n=1 Tax=Rhodopila sp. TaxID=2480087 RepID=UPI002BDF7685